VIDRLPPHSLEAEQSVLGADPDRSRDDHRDRRIPAPEDFYRQAHGNIYKAMLELFERREPVDLVTVAESLERGDDLEQIGGRPTSPPSRT
jgi:replicative DNA helicase